MKNPLSYKKLSLLAGILLMPFLGWSQGSVLDSPVIQSSYGMENFSTPFHSDGLNETSREITLDDFRYIPWEKNLYSLSENGDSLQLNPLEKSAGLAFLGSAAVPGLSQAFHKNWIRAGIYLAAEATLIYLYAYNESEAQTGEDRYKQFANNNWSVVNYAKWLVDYNHYHGRNLDVTYDDLAAQGQTINGEPPAYEINVDWQRVNIRRLRDLEEKTLHHYKDGGTGLVFSHHLPSYGSQQYYELISKYYQYGPGWRDYYTGIPYPQRTMTNTLYELNFTDADMPGQWKKGARLADEFNDHYRVASNMLTVLILNHIVSAFDAFFTVQLRDAKIEATSGNSMQQYLKVKMSF